LANKGIHCCRSRLRAKPFPTFWLRSRLCVLWLWLAEVSEAKASSASSGTGPIQMALELASSLRRLGRFWLNDVRLRYLTWFLLEGTDTGPVSARVFELISFGVEPADAVAQVHREFGGLTAGCNPAHRAAPLAMCSFIADDDLPATAVQEAKLTHEHGLAGDVSAAVVVLCRALIRGAAWSEALEVAVVARQPATQATMSLAITPALRSGGFAPDVLRAGISFVDRHSSFEAALSEALRFAGPANYCPVLGGLNRRRTVGCFRDCYRRLSKERDFEASA
jgi:ADP-ribosylglycohydrolase